VAPLLDDEFLEQHTKKAPRARISYTTTKERKATASKYRSQLKLKSLNQLIDMAMDFFFNALEEREKEHRRGR
jgi:hypothetical protein